MLYVRRQKEYLYRYVLLNAVEKARRGRKARRAPSSTMNSKSSKRVDKEAQRQTSKVRRQAAFFCCCLVVWANFNDCGAQGTIGTRRKTEAFKAR